MVLVESILKPVEREWGKICTNRSHLYTEEQPRRHETRVSKLEHQFLSLGFRSGKQLHDEETRNSD